MLIAQAPSTGTIATGLLQSMLDETEERRREEERQKSGQKPDPVTEARIAASEEARQARDRISGALFSATRVDLNELKAQLYQKLGESVGVEQTDDMSSYAYGRAIETALAELSPQATIDLKAELGLDELGLSLSTVIEAIKNPYADAAVTLETALEKQHGNGSMTQSETAKVLQRLEDVADPKTLAELKLGDQGYDPTRVADEETDTERLEDIAAREASAKLDDVQEMHRALAERNAAAAATGSLAAQAGTTDDAADAPEDLLVIFAAALESAGTDAASTDETAQSVASSADAGQEADLAGSQQEAPLSEAARAEQAAEQAEAEMGLSEPLDGLIGLSLDELGLYRLLKPTRELVA
ncbi:hypothetical protein [Rhizobium sp. CSW-27]|uniref:hypothetical protein n=1 Tax=Rhizobium sp. CSW-27 TaxID=2839985 RepID=UPI001C01124C|nr:hypothetical protein [Rhizobium sp. CSW-27]MBT9371560.1 hypothetical protein [Rhizobium sp. CSW-27]